MQNKIKLALFALLVSQTYTYGQSSVDDLLGSLTNDLNEFKKYFYDDIRIKLIEKSNFLSRSAKKKDFISKIS